MGTSIEAVATASPGGHLFDRGSLKLADDAAKSCLDRAGRTSDDVDLLVNTGLYHDRNLGEPALAALIQEDIGANPGHPPTFGHGTFSFDLYNGGCGVLTAISIVDGFLASGTADLGMVVTADADPAPGVSRGFTFAPLGGAVLLRWAHDTPGFSDFCIETFPQYADLFRSEVRWVPSKHRVGHRRGRNVLQVEVADDYRERALDCAADAAQRFSQKVELDLRAVDVLIATGSVGEFGEMLADRLGLSGEQVVSPAGPLSTAHTAGPLVALEAAMRGGQLAAAATTLVVSAGAGITVALALYRS